MSGRYNRWNSGRRRRRKWFDYAIAAGFLAAVAILADAVSQLSTEEHSGRARISDGDSLEIGGNRFRLVGIDAPELAQTCRVDRKEIACGGLAKRHLEGLIGRRTVECAGWERDRYGRLLAVCRAGGRDLNREMVAAGWALAYGDYGAEEQVARDARRGIWRGEFEPPKEWRRDGGNLAGAPDEGYTAEGAGWLGTILAEWRSRMAWLHGEEEQ